MVEFKVIWFTIVPKSTIMSTINCLNNNTVEQNNLTPLHICHLEKKDRFKLLVLCDI